MARFLVAAKVSLAIALALANALCFVQCLVHPCDAGAMPCHSHGPANSHACPPQHDLKVATAAPASAAIPVLNTSNSIEAAAPTIARSSADRAAYRLSALPDARPPQPLRI
jgi:hypothetical protein